MPGKIFVNYRRDDERAFAARVRDRLAQTFGDSNVFMDVDNLMAGQRFDRELEKALAETDVFLAVIGPRWTDLYRQRQASGERDYVHEEIAGALKRGITVIPVLIEGAQLPRQDLLPEDIRELVLHHKQDVGHEHFGQNVTALVEAIRFARQSGRKPLVMPKLKTGTLAMVLASGLGGMAAAYVGAYYSGVPLPWFTAPPADTRSAELERLREAASKAEGDRKRIEVEAASRLAAEQKARVEAEARAKRIADAAEKAARDEAARKKAEDDARARAAAEAEAKRKADEAERQRVAAAEAKRLADLAAAEERRKAQEMSPGRVFRDCTEGCPEMVVVAAGRFKMGEGSSARNVTIQQAFAVGKFEVTFDEWAACVAGGGCKSNRSPSDQGWGKGRRPVINVSWNDAKEYVAWLSRKTGQTYRLLSEAEWEYAARAGTTTAYWWGDKFDGSKANNGSQTVPVGQYAANAFGLHDMHGNVWEWCEDAYDSSSRVVRGGSWSNVPVYLRSSDRDWFGPDYRNGNLGFRVARVLPPARTL